MVLITESEFARICAGIREDREQIIRHNPLGSAEEILLWMLLSCLISYLSLSENETPCFTGRLDAATYKHAIIFILRDRRTTAFDIEVHLDKLLAE
jgi:hypothetical protein